VPKAVVCGRYQTSHVCSLASVAFMWCIILSIPWTFISIQTAQAHVHRLDFGGEYY
jgi:hypothetical protein